MRISNQFLKTGPMDFWVILTLNGYFIVLDLFMGTHNHRDAL